MLGGRLLGSVVGVFNYANQLEFDTVQPSSQSSRFGDKCSLESIQAMVEILPAELDLTFN
jgi:hypothetical protein